MNMNNLYLLGTVTSCYVIKKLYNLKTAANVSENAEIFNESDVSTQSNETDKSSQVSSETDKSTRSSKSSKSSKSSRSSKSSKSSKSAESAESEEKVNCILSNNAVHQINKIKKNTYEYYETTEEESDIEERDEIIVDPLIDTTIKPLILDYDKIIEKIFNEASTKVNSYDECLNISVRYINKSFLLKKLSCNLPSKFNMSKYHFTSRVEKHIPIYSGIGNNYVNYDIDNIELKNRNFLITGKILNEGLLGSDSINTVCNIIISNETLSKLENVKLVSENGNYLYCYQVNNCNFYSDIFNDKKIACTKALHDIIKYEYDNRPSRIFLHNFANRKYKETTNLKSFTKNIPLWCVIQVVQEFGFPCEKNFTYPKLMFNQESSNDEKYEFVQKMFYCPDYYVMNSCKNYNDIELLPIFYKDQETNIFYKFKTDIDCIKEDTYNLFILFIKFLLYSKIPLITRWKHYNETINFVGHPNKGDYHKPITTSDYIICTSTIIGFDDSYEIDKHTGCFIILNSRTIDNENKDFFINVAYHDFYNYLLHDIYMLYKPTWEHLKPIFKV